MGRRIVTSSDLEAGRQSPEISLDKSFLDRLVKYIPSDILSVWLVVSNASFDESNIGLFWLSFGAFTIITPIWVHFQTRVPGKDPARKQIISSLLAFILWAFAIGKPFSQYEFYDPTQGIVAIAVGVLIIGLIDLSGKNQS